MNGGKLVGVYGASGLGSEVMAYARTSAMAAGLDRDRLVFVDDSPKVLSLVGQKVLTFEQFCASSADHRTILMGIGDSATREALATKCKAAKIEIGSIIATGATLLDNVVIDEGAVICPYALLSSNVTIGRLFQANIYSYVAHDCVVEDCVTLAPGAKVNGNVHIGRGAYIGTGAIVKHGLPGAPLIIGAGATVGMGAIVTKSVPPGATVVGNPARIKE